MSRYRVFQSVIFILPLLALRVNANFFQQAYIKASNPGTNDNFGRVIAISGDTMAVAAVYESSSAAGVNGNQADDSKPLSGAVYVFVRNGTTWAQQAYIKASNPDLYDTFGLSIALSGNTLVVGAPQESSSATGVDGNQANNGSPNSGAAYVFVRNGTTWSQQAYLKASNTGSNDFFGNSVAIDGDTIVVGAPSEDSAAVGINGNQADNSSVDSGAAYVFNRSGTNWTQQAYLKASNTETNDQFSTSVAVSGDTIAVSAGQESSNGTGVNGNQFDNSAPGAGAAYVFVRSGTNWTQQAYVKASNTESNDFFGFSLSLSGDTLAVSAALEDSSSTGVNGNQLTNSAPDAGAAYVFVRNGTAWSQQAYLKASNTRSNYYFGFSVAVQGDSLIVGSVAESSSATGINGNQTNTAANFAGAAYLFRRNGTSWSQAAYLKASNTEADDGFGSTVAISGQTLAVGAYAESSGSPGLNGNQSDNSVEQAGAAYAFVDLVGAEGPPLSIVPAGYFLRFTGIPGVSYDLQRAPSLSGPWTTIATIVAPASGFVEYHEATPPPGQSFYRTAQ
jgi:hypothetical protein